MTTPEPKVPQPIGIVKVGWRCPSCGKPFDELPEHHTFTYGDDQSQAICFNVPLEQP